MWDILPVYMCFDAFCSLHPIRQLHKFCIWKLGYTVLHFFLVCFYVTLFFSKELWVSWRQGGPILGKNMKKVNVVYTAPLPLCCSLTRKKPPTLKGPPAMKFPLGFIQIWIPLPPPFPASLRGCVGKIILTSCKARNYLKMLLVERSWFRHILF